VILWSLLIFWFDGGVLIWLPGPLLLPGLRGLLLFTAMLPAHKTGAESGLVRYLGCNVCFHNANK
jgi:hypothetical protein